tara:strand:- start:567 stop:1112 length:546 start_codon:yes stop_codon:yes gene_type:complete
MNNKSVYDAPSVSTDISRYIITVLVDNEPGVLARVVGMFSGRGYNIDSLNVAEVVANEHLSRITIVTHGTNDVVDLIRKQLMTIVPVHSVTNLEEEGGPVEAEVALIYLFLDVSNKKEVFNICDFYRARKIENEHNSTIFEIAGTSERIDAFIKEISKIVKTEVVRSGPIAISSLDRSEEK